jgi:hypothetical protein
MASSAQIPASLLAHEQTKVLDMLHSPLQYTDSRLNWTTTLCFVDCQVTGMFIRKKMTLIVLFVASTSPAKSASLNLVNIT